MTSLARVTFLGTGTSHGVPMIGCDCATCRSADPRDRRWRASILIELTGGHSVLVDTPPDLRTQALAFDVRRVDAIFFTHAHADHVLGLDEVRRYNALQHASIPCYADEQTITEIRRTFAYIFNPPQVGGGVPKIDLFCVAGPFCLWDETFVPVPLMHGTQPVLGYRVGPFAYLTDCSAIPDESWPLVEDVDVLVIDALRYRPHPTHFTVDEALAAVERIGPRAAYFTHICHDLPHAATNARLPAGVQLAYDGLVLDWPAEAARPQTRAGGPFTRDRLEP